VQKVVENEATGQVYKVCLHGELSACGLCGTVSDAVGEMQNAKQQQWLLACWLASLLAFAGLLTTFCFWLCRWFWN
jgi:hypothetical protein